MCRLRTCVVYVLACCTLLSGLTPQRVVARQAAAALKRLTFDDLKFDIEKDAPYDPALLTDAIRELEGRRIQIRGYMLPSFLESGLTEFTLVRDNMECCFGPGAALYDCIRVTMQEGRTCDYSIRPVTVEGTFTTGEFIGPDERVWAIYFMQAESVK